MIDIIKYNTEEGAELIDKILSRDRLEHGNARRDAEAIVAEVRKNGDKALFEYTKRFDCFELTAETVKVTEEEIDEAYRAVESGLIEIIRTSVARIRSFHEKQKQNSWFDTSKQGELLGQIITPIERAGVYVPGGKAAYPSTVLMNIVPAAVAGVNRIIMVSPVKENGRLNPATLVAAKEAGVTDIYKVGGAQAVAALAFGTDSIPRVDKIVGPGNIYVTNAKRAVFGYVGIDSIAGPSEILVIADETANAGYVAADLLSQAEHDEMASAVLITTSRALAEEVREELIKQTEALSRKDIITQSLRDFGMIILADSLAEAAELSNRLAPEHLEICTDRPFELLPLIKNAGAIFMGHYSPEPLGDYMAGPNHVLPTGGTARFFSPLCVDDFTKKSSLLSFTKEGLAALSDSVTAFAEAEGLTAHANAVKIRKDASHV